MIQKLENSIEFTQGEVDTLDCKTVLFFVKASDSQYSNERFKASLKTARENGERLKITTVRHAYLNLFKITRSSSNEKLLLV